MSENNIAAKISKLIAHEASARSIGNQAEAEAFAAKIAELLANHKLSMSDVEIKAQEVEDPFGCTFTKKGPTNSTARWRLDLARAIASAFFCHYAYVGGSNKVVFYGRDSDRKAAVEMYEMLASTAKYLAKKDYKMSPACCLYPTNSSYAQKWCHTFQLGFAHGVAVRLGNESRLLMQKDTGAALILRETAALQAYMKSVHLGRGRSRKQSISDYGAYAQGKERGSNAELTRRLALGRGK